MKKLISLFTIAVCFLFSSAWTAKPGDIQEQSVIGLWNVFFEDEKVTDFDCNDCPTWEFKKDHTLIFTRYDKLQETTTWRIDEKGILHFGDTLTGFQGTHLNKMSKIPVKVIFSKNGDYTELRFSNKGKLTPVILRKKIKE